MQITKVVSMAKKTIIVEGKKISEELRLKRNAETLVARANYNLSELEKIAISFETVGMKDTADKISTITSIMRCDLKLLERTS